MAKITAKGARELGRLEVRHKTRGDCLRFVVTSDGRMLQSWTPRHGRGGGFKVVQRGSTALMLLELETRQEYFFSLGYLIVVPAKGGDTPP